MLTIRDDQLALFENASLTQLEEDLVAHLRDAFPVDFELAGEAGIRACVHLAVRRADAYGLQTRGQFCRYLHLAVTFGTHFDRDPLLPWVARTLRNPRLADPDGRIDRLEHCALRQLGRVTGETGELYRKAVIRVRRLEVEDYSCRPDELELAMWDLLGRTYPEWYDHAPDAGLREFARVAIDRIRNEGLQPERGALIVPMAMCMLGTHAAEDPLYPWIGETLDDASLVADAASVGSEAGSVRHGEPGAREAAMISSAADYVERSLALIRAAGGE
jgi:hypothetical protein